eukprot:TRINITY_DN21419_c0_g1_i3.p2 TRINITY_DN21419_c0_g1~~TRINITY_DN21419_c0_g1_i3.p2  ORF type:complete len:205 (+),score=29.95 TRINITY_DN21419_c0_g1_i3:106-720(+)
MMISNLSGARGPGRRTEVVEITGEEQERIARSQRAVVIQLLQVREIRAAVQRAVLVPTALELVMHTEEVGKNYADQVRGMSPQGRGLGSPHPLKLKCVIHFLMEEESKAQQRQPWLALLREIFTILHRKPQEEQDDMATLCRFEKACRAQGKKLVFSTRAEAAAEEAIVKAVLKHVKGSKRLAGTAPQGALERELQSTASNNRS